MISLGNTLVTHRDVTSIIILYTIALYGQSMRLLYIGPFSGSGFGIAGFVIGGGNRVTLYEPEPHLLFRRQTAGYTLLL